MEPTASAWGLGDEVRDVKVNVHDAAVGGGEVEDVEAAVAKGDVFVSGLGGAGEVSVEPLFFGAKALHEVFGAEDDHGGVEGEAVAADEGGLAIGWARSAADGEQKDPGAEQGGESVHDAAS